MRTLFDNAEITSVPTPPPVLAVAPTVKVTEAYDAWWGFAYERQRIYFRRLNGQAAPWTEDPTLSRYRFTNAYRAADRVSQYLITDVIYRDDLPQDPNEVVFRILLFKLFNRIETWEMLTSQLGSVVLADDPFARINELLSGELDARRRIYSAAYIMPTGSSGSGKARKHETHLALLQKMMADSLGDRLADAPNMRAGFDLLRSYPMIGDFLAYQFITDINYSKVVDFSESEFVAAGPGAREGLRKCFVDPGGWSDSDLIRMMMDLQEEEFQRLGLEFRDLFGRPLKLIDCQNVFCEVSKYARARFPALTAPGGRKRIKQKYQLAREVSPPFFPPKWGINNAVIALFPQSAKGRQPDLVTYQAQARRTSFHDRVPGGDAITTPMLGLIGETGEVVSELKKRAREGPAYVAFGDRLGEELGDLLWYVSDLATRCGIRLDDLDETDDYGGADKRATVDEGAWILSALSLAEQVGRISKAYEGLLGARNTKPNFDSQLRKALSSLLADVRLITSLHGLSMADVVQDNLTKVEQRWVVPKVGSASSEQMWPESASELLPARFDATLIDQDGRVSIVFSIGGETIPAVADSLTDNAYHADGYRFHDVFHLAYAAVLDWSPVTRKLLRRKRKSDPRVDEVEDGGRAAVIEEGISALVFAYAARHRMLEGVKTIEGSLLRTIRDMTNHLEVRERTAAEWQDAIIQGFNVWRRIYAAEGGSIRVDRLARRIRYLECCEQDPIAGELPCVQRRN
ncbi:MAG: putative DNA base hypermodification protein [Rhodospirillaceae bacterium]|nr:putative DNA base hypermodification protein [Rhodospirillaceae bacterium]